METERYFKKSFYGDKSIPARIIDHSTLVCAIFALSFITYWNTVRSIKQSIIFTVLTTVILCVIYAVLRRRKYCAFKEKSIKKLKEKCMLEALMLKSESDFKKTILKIFGYSAHTCINGAFLDGKDCIYIFENHPDIPINAQQVLSAYRKTSALGGNRVFISMSDPDESADALFKKLYKSYTLLLGADIINSAAEKNMLTHSSDIERYIDIELEVQKSRIKSIRSNVIDSSKIKGYAICTVLLTVWPFFTGYSPIYTIGACTTAVLAFLSTYKKKKEQ